MGALLTVQGEGRMPFSQLYVLLKVSPSSSPLLSSPYFNPSPFPHPAPLPSFVFLFCLTASLHLVSLHSDITRTHVSFLLLQLHPQLHLCLFLSPFSLSISLSLFPSLSLHHVFICMVGPPQPKTIPGAVTETHIVFATEMLTSLPVVLCYLMKL